MSPHRYVHTGPHAAAHRAMAGDRYARRLGDTIAMMGRWGQGDLLAGAAAAAVLVLLVRVLNLNPVYAILLAIAIYVGIVLMRPLPKPRSTASDVDPARPDDGYRTAQASAAAIRALAPGIAKSDVRAQVERISDNIDRVLAAILADGNLSAAPIFTSIFLDTYEQYLDDYVYLSNRAVKSATRGLQQFETHDLPKYERAVDNFYEQLHRKRVVDLEALSAELEFNLESITPPSEHGPTSPPALPPANGDLPRPADHAEWGTVINSEEAARFGLTAREIEILPLLTQRLTDREIAERLCISHRTVERHASSIFGKLGVSNRRELREFLERHDLLPHSEPSGAHE